ncbi:hypothetical protein SESBI_02590 [Sesbania bispinosa]|nr:hypothetical protein SESBI_02590 [Sesbania bispinosa]
MTHPHHTQQIENKHSSNKVSHAALSAGDMISKVSLIGKIITSNTIDPNMAKTILLQEWQVQEGVCISLVGRNMFVLHFSDEHVVHRIKLDAPWNVLGNLLNLQHRYPDRPIEQLHFNHNPF